MLNYKKPKPNINRSKVGSKLKNDKKKIDKEVVKKMIELIRKGNDIKDEHPPENAVLCQ